MERVMRQAHPTFATHLRGSNFRDLDELASEANTFRRTYSPRMPKDHLPQPRRHSSRDARGTETAFAPIQRKMVCLPLVMNAGVAGVT
ncbi:hypothetical protein HPB50_004033 [Hyalomma asiaticum]|uniref:Uncharacterized protein n=1 Tax=Hyalomma asiaticum TaxID=266040 RepID=A0ACB7SRK0_HYAAI|nr:hypothetical protein HPB50_004033 [Hyalomma asiaticum]